MDNQLRPMNLGEILDRTADLYRTRFPFFAGISAIFAAAMLAVQLLYLGAIHLLGYPRVPSNHAVVFVLLLCTNLLAISLLAGLSIAAFNRAVAWVYLGKPATVRAAVSSIFSKMRRYVGLTILVMLRAWAPLVGVYVLLFGILFAAGIGGGFFAPHGLRHSTNLGPAALAGAVVGFLLIMLLFIPAAVYGIVLWLRYSLAMPACVVEELTATKAIRRSIELSEGARGRIFVLWLLVFAVRLILSLLFGFPAIVLAVKHLGQPQPMGWMIFQEFGVFATNTLIGPIYSIGLTLFYYDQRIRKEGFDIEWMMHAAGLLPQQTGSEPATSILG